MSMRDHANHIQLKRVISPVSEAGNNALVGQIIDRQDAESLTYLILIGSLGDAGAEFAVLLEHGDDAALGDASAVADADMISQTYGTAPEAAASFIQSDDDEVRKLGYIGDKRYSRLTITPANNGTASLIAAAAILKMKNTPVVQASA